MNADGLRRAFITDGTGNKAARTRSARHSGGQYYPVMNGALECNGEHYSRGRRSLSTRLKRLWRSTPDAAAPPPGTDPAILAPRLITPADVVDGSDVFKRDDALDLVLPLIMAVGALTYCERVLPAAKLPRDMVRDDLDYALAAGVFDFGAHHRDRASSVHHARFDVERLAVAGADVPGRHVRQHHRRRHRGAGAGGAMPNEIPPCTWPTRLPRCGPIATRLRAPSAVRRGTPPQKCCMNETCGDVFCERGVACVEDRALMRLRACLRQAARPAAVARAATAKEPSLRRAAGRGAANSPLA